MASSCGCVRKGVGPSSRDAGARVASGSPPDPENRRVPTGAQPRDEAPRFRFGRTLRLTSRRQFQAVYEHGSKAACVSFVVFGRPNGLGRCRLGLTITRRFGGAVQRNRAKRRLREVFRLNHHRLPASMDLVINGRRGLLERGSDQLARDLMRCVERLARRVER